LAQIVVIGQLLTARESEFQLLIHSQW